METDEQKKCTQAPTQITQDKTSMATLEGKDMTSPEQKKHCNEQTPAQQTLVNVLSLTLEPVKMKETIPIKNNAAMTKLGSEEPKEADMNHPSVEETPSKDYSTQ